MGKRKRHQGHSIKWVGEDYELVLLIRGVGENRYDPENKKKEKMESDRRRIFPWLTFYDWLIGQLTMTWL